MIGHAQFGQTAMDVPRVEMAHREIDNEVRFAQKELRKQVGDLAVQQGKQIIEQEINEEDQRRLIRTYIDEFGK